MTKVDNNENTEPIVKQTKKLFGFASIIFIVLMLLLLPVFVVIIYGSINTLQFRSFANRFEKIDTPEKTNELFRYSHSGLTAYNGTYCHYLKGKFFETKKSIGEIRNYYRGQRIKNKEGKLTHVRLIIYNGRSGKYETFNNDDKWLAENFLSKDLREKHPTLFKKLAKRQNENINYFFIFVDGFYFRKNE